MATKTKIIGQTRKLISDPVNYAVGATFLLLIAGLRIIVMNLNRGLDWSDESWILVLLSNNQVTAGEPWGFQHLLQPLWSLFGSTIIGARIARLMLYQLGAIIAAFAMYKWAISMGIMERTRTLVFTLFAAEISMLLAWAYWPRTLGYNELGAFLVTTGVSISIWMIATARSNRNFTTMEQWLFPAALGITAAALILTKATSGTLLALGAALVVCLTSPQRAFLRLANYLGSMVVTLIVAWAFGFPMQNYLRAVIKMATDAAYAASFAHAPDLIEINRNELVTTGVALAPALLALMGGAAAIWLQQKQINNRLTANLGLFVVVVLAAVSASRIADQTDALGKAGLLGQSMGILALGIMLVFSWQREPLGIYTIRMRTVVVIGATAIAAAPLISSIGTNGRLPFHITFNQSLWGAAFGVAILLLADQFKPYPIKRFIAALILPTAALFAFLSLAQDREAPYRSAPYAAQTEPVKAASPLFQGLKLTTESAAVLVWLEQTGQSYQDVPVIAPASPGALLAFNNHSFASPWTEAFWPGSFGTITRECQSGGKPSQLVVIMPSNVQPDTPNYDLLTDALGGCEISFPDQFDLIGISPADENGVTYAVWKYTLS